MLGLVLAGESVANTPTSGIVPRGNALASVSARADVEEPNPSVARPVEVGEHEQVRNAFEAVEGGRVFR